MCVSSGIQSLVLRGRISEAVRLVRSSYPGLLENNLELMFRLKCRQFVEMIGGYDTVDLLTSLEPRLSCHSELSSSSGSPEQQSRSMGRISPAAQDSSNGEVNNLVRSYAQEILCTTKLLYICHFNFRLC